MKFSIKQLVVMALLIAISAALGAFFSIPVTLGAGYSLNISLNLLPPMLAGYLFGPIAGAIVGAMSDIAKWVINPRGPYLPQFTITMMLLGACPALIGRYLVLKKSPFMSILIAVSASMLLLSVGLNTFFISTIYGSAFLALIPARLLNAVVMSPIYAVLLNELLKRRDLMRV